MIRGGKLILNLNPPICLTVRLKEGALALESSTSSRLVSKYLRVVWIIGMFFQTEQLRLHYFFKGASRLFFLSSVMDQKYAIGR